jgi:predicted nuclease of predicted toxin-antitoxin system
MRFLVDAQLPIGLARMLQHGHESKHVADLIPLFMFAKRLNKK